jgi:hypothetical protein
MAQTPEAAVKKEIRRVLEVEGVLQRAPTTRGYGKSGQLDFTCCAYGYYVGIEAKSIHSKYGAKGPTALQWQEIDEIRSHGGIAMSIDETNYDVLERVLWLLSTDRPDGAKWVADETLTRHTRPPANPTPDDGIPQPTLKKSKKETP